MDTFYKPIDIAQTATVQAVPSGFTRLQAKPDGNLYVVNAAGETMIGAGGGGDIIGVAIDGGNAMTMYTAPAIRIDFGKST